MRSTNTQRLSVCVSAASGQQEATTLTTLNRRVAQVFAGRTRSMRELDRMNARMRFDQRETTQSLEALKVAAAAQLKAMRADRDFWAGVSPPVASDPLAADCGGSS